MNKKNQQLVGRDSCANRQHPLQNRPATSLTIWRLCLGKNVKQLSNG
jgi:hypothetical protein